MARRQNLQKSSFLSFTRDVCRPLNEINSDSSGTLPVLANIHFWVLVSWPSHVACQRTKMHVCQFRCNWNVCSRRAAFLSVYWLLLLPSHGNFSTLEIKFWQQLHQIDRWCGWKAVTNIHSPRRNITYNVCLHSIGASCAQNGWMNETNMITLSVHQHFTGVASDGEDAFSQWWHNAILNGCCCTYTSHFVQIKFNRLRQFKRMHSIRKVGSTRRHRIWMRTKTIVSMRSYRQRWLSDDVRKLWK